MDKYSSQYRYGQTQMQWQLRTMMTRNTSYLATLNLSIFVTLHTRTSYTEDRGILSMLAPLPHPPSWHCRSLGEGQTSVPGVPSPHLAWCVAEIVTPGSVADGSWMTCCKWRGGLRMQLRVHHTWKDTRTEGRDEQLFKPGDKFLPSR